MLRAYVPFGMPRIELLLVSIDQVRCPAIQNPALTLCSLSGVGNQKGSTARSPNKPTIILGELCWEMYVAGSHHLPHNILVLLSGRTQDILTRT